MADFNKPATTDSYANVLAYLKATIADLALGMDPATTTPTNVPTNAVRWNSANNRFEKYNGTTWAALSAAFAFQDITASGNLTLSGGTAFGVPYLGASKQVTTGTELKFDGNTFIVNSAAGYFGGGADYGVGLSVWTLAGGVGGVAGGELGFYTGSTGARTEKMHLGTTSLWLANGISFGIGTSLPAAKLNIESGDVLVRGGKFIVGPTAGGNGAGAIRGLLSGALGSLIFQTENASAVLTDVATLDGYGNFGLGATPYSWWSGSRAFDFGTTSALMNSNSGTDVWNNAYFNGTSTLYKTTSYATLYRQSSSGQHQWFIAPSGTAGSATSLTQAMTLDASGNWMVGTTGTLGSSKVTVLGSNGTKVRVSDTVNAAWRGYTFGVNDNTDYASMLFNANSGELQILAGPNSGYGGFLTLATAGVERARIDTSGQFGLGTSAPDRRFVVASDGTSWISGTFAGVGGTDRVVLGNLAGITTVGGHNSALNAWAPFAISGSYLALQTSGTERARIFASGGMSLGNTTDPGAGNLSVNGTISAGGSAVTPIVQATSQATTSGTAKDFTGIPSWVKRITVMFRNVSTNGSSNIIVQLGTSGGLQTLSYNGGISSGNNAIVTSQMSAGFDCAVTNGSSAVIEGQVILNNHSGNVWTMSGITHHSETTTFCFSAGSVSLTGVLTQLRVTTNSGTNTFDLGSVNIIYE